MTEYFPVTFVHLSAIYYAQLTNLSDKGAHLLVSNVDPMIHCLFVGTELNLNILTPYGNSLCTVKMMWIDPEVTPLSIGVEFIYVSADPSDPLRCAIDSPL